MQYSEMLIKHYFCNLYRTVVPDSTEQDEDHTEDSVSPAIAMASPMSVTKTQGNAW